MAIGSNKSKFNGKKAASTSHSLRDTAEDEDDIEEEKPRESKEEREKRKKTVKIGTEKGVGFSHRKMTKKEKKCLEKGKKKMEKLVKREKDQDVEHKEGVD
jgi:hypothetical protein